MKPDPPAPDGGNCAQCGKPRKPERSRKYAGVEAETDPFCKTECCHRWHKISYTGTPTGRAWTKQAEEEAA